MNGQSWRIGGSIEPEDLQWAMTAPKDELIRLLSDLVPDEMGSMRSIQIKRDLLLNIIQSRNTSDLANISQELTGYTHQIKTQMESSSKLTKDLVDHAAATQSHDKRMFRFTIANTVLTGLTVGATLLMLIVVLKQWSLNSQSAELHKETKVLREARAFRDVYREMSTNLSQIYTSINVIEDARKGEYQKAKVFLPVRRPELKAAYHFLASLDLAPPELSTQLKIFLLTHHLKQLDDSMISREALKASLAGIGTTDRFRNLKDVDDYLYTRLINDRERIESFLKTFKSKFHTRYQLPNLIIDVPGSTPFIP